MATKRPKSVKLKGAPARAYTNDIASRAKRVLTRYFLAQDNSCHWYLVPDERRDDWYKWVGLDEDCEDSWNVPDYAKRLTFGPENVTFANPAEDGI